MKKQQSVIIGMTNIRRLLLLLFVVVVLLFSSQQFQQHSSSKFSLVVHAYTTSQVGYYNVRHKLHTKTGTTKKIMSPTPYCHEMMSRGCTCPKRTTPPPQTWLLFASTMDNTMIMEPSVEVVEEDLMDRKVMDNNKEKKDDDSTTDTTSLSNDNTTNSILLSMIEMENSKFQCDGSVQYWRTIDIQPNDVVPTLTSIVEKYILQVPNTDTSRSSSSSTTTSTITRAYWIYHLLRSGYFSMNAITGLLAHGIYERFLVNVNNNNNNNHGNEENIDVEKRITPILQNMDSAGGLYGPLLVEAMYQFEQEFVRYILPQYNNNNNNKDRPSTGLNIPWDVPLELNQLNHKQLNPIFALSETSRLLQESIGIWGRRMRLEGKQSNQVWFNRFRSSTSTTNSQTDMNGQQQQQQVTTYPSYYLNDFHYQTDGWLSSESAARYEVSTETLFLGRQDSMQRQTLLPILSYYDNNHNNHNNNNNKGFPRNYLEVACGTGRHATFARDQFPTLPMTLVDLSPFYLEKARENIEYWRQVRSPTAMSLFMKNNNNNNRSSGSRQQQQQQQQKKDGMAPDNTNYIQANAELLPFPNESFDVVTNVYLFHELPPEARDNVVREMVRVCTRGGIIVLSDSLQLGDRPNLDKTIDLNAFRKLNEPYYTSYLTENLSMLFEKYNCSCYEKYLSSRTKTLSFIKN